MPADPQPDPEFEDGLVRAFDQAAEHVRSESQPLVTGGLVRGRVRRRRRRIAALTGSVTAVAVIAGGGLFAAALGSSPPVPTSHALTEAARSAPPRLDKGVNILLMGVDSRTALDGSAVPDSLVRDQLHAGSSDLGGFLTDTLLVLHIPAGGDGRVEAVSIPREDYVQSAGADGGMQKISYVYGIAKAAAEAKLQGKGLSPAQLAQQGSEAGRTATIATVQQFLGIPIDHFAEVDMLGFYDIAQAVGPIQVCLNHATSDSLGSGFSGRAGINTLDPAQALAFVRQRHGLPNADLDRTHRQQAFIASALHTLGQQGLFGDLGKAQGLLAAVKKDVVIDDQWNLLDFMQQVPDLVGGNVEFNTLPITGFATVSTRGFEESVNTVDPVRIRQVVQQLFGGAPAASGSPASGAALPSAPTAPTAPTASGGAPPVGPAVQGNEGIPCVD
ncbi:LCP family protein [Kitasatospora sp. NBC_01266]|uniref:LCP family protein n=1 Tax=Kitasatospora sp. NBC_01266 TaxID=2903572 RepID=UPI002E37AF2E|nr:LCP family protein [Kitasatospora sp. NBC_01266]